MDVLEIEIDKELKEQVQALLQVILFIKECVRIKGLLFEVNDPLLGVKPQTLTKDHPSKE